jgi:hypothetical protein
MGKEELPPLWKQAWNYTKALYRKRVAEINGDQVYVEQEEFEDRLSVCRGTKEGYKKPCLKYLVDEDEDPPEERCSQCGCYLEEKAALATEWCPLYMWEGDVMKRMSLIGGSHRDG